MDREAEISMSQEAKRKEFCKTFCCSTQETKNRACVVSKGLKKINLRSKSIRVASITVPSPAPKTCLGEPENPALEGFPKPALEGLVTYGVHFWSIC